MSSESMLFTLLEIARDVTGEDDLSFSANTPFETIEAWDSLNHVHMLVAIEKKFGVHFADGIRLQGVVQVQDLLDIISDLQKGQ
jgi:acyl carrier protein